MARIKTIMDNELIGGTDTTDVYPVSSSQAIFRQTEQGTVPEGIQHQKLEDSLKDIETDAKELHRKSEKLVVYLVNNQNNKTLEIDGNVNTMSLSGSANIETFGDEPEAPIAPANMTVKELSVIFSSASTSVEGHASGNNWVGTYTMPNVVGTYTAKFNCTYNGINKYVTSNTNLNLRKYFGFAEEQPASVEDLIALVEQEKATSDFSNSVGCTVTIPANGTGFKRIYLSVPNNMTISRVVQPDALNAPLAITQVEGTITRTITIDGVDHTFEYKLYRSNDLIDSSVSKRLTIS